MKRTLAMLLALLMIFGLMPLQIFAYETDAEEAAVVAEAAEDQITEEILAEEAAAVDTAEEIVEITDEQIVISDSFAAEVQETPDPVLGYVYLYSPGDNSWKVHDWDMNQNGGILGWQHMDVAPGDNFLVFYLNVWNSATNSWEHQPVHVDFGQYLSGELLKNGDYSFMPGAKDTDYYYRMEISTDGWDKTTQVTYNYNGEELAVEVEIRRNEDGWYTSEIMRNETYILGNYKTSRLSPESNVLYFGFQSEYWTLVSADFTANYVEIVGYDPANAISVQNLGSSKYKITLDPWLVSTGKNFEICARITVQDPDGYTEEWEPRVWVGTDENRQRASMGINYDWLEFFEENGVTKAMRHEETDMFYEWGDVVHVLKEVELPAGVSYDMPTNTLTLNNANLARLSINYAWYDYNTGNSGTDLPNENLTIKLVGTNTIEGDDECILGLGDEVKATITGTGTLNIKGKFNDPFGWGPVINIWNGAELIIDGGTVNVNAEMINPADDNWPVAINVDRGCALTVNGGKLTLNAKNYRTALMLNGDYTQNGGQVDITLDNEKAGMKPVDDSYVDIHVAYGISSKGYTTINGGTLKVDSYVALEIGYDSGDPENPDWPPQPNVKFVLNNGTVELKGKFRAAEIYAPAELKGGSLKASNTGDYNPIAGRHIGQAICVWDNGSEEVKAYLAISGGEHHITAATGDNVRTYGIVADTGEVSFTGGDTTIKGVWAITGQSLDPANKDALEIAADMDIIDLSTNTCKKLLSGEYLYSFETEMVFYINSIEADNHFDAEQWWEGTSDECSQVRITGHNWSAATCTSPKTCSYCKATEGKPADHVYDNNVDGTCNVCGVNRETVEDRIVVHMFRMYNPNTGEHFYTGSEEEKNNLIGHGWQYEGVGFTFPANTGDPVHRLFQPSTGEHLYTMDNAEKDRLMADGWNYEGIAFNSAYDTEAIQHRLHNPNATVGAYHFTFSLEEKQNLIDAGWEYQGIGWYSCWK